MIVRDRRVVVLWKTLSAALRAQLGHICIDSDTLKTGETDYGSSIIASDKVKKNKKAE